MPSVYDTIQRPPKLKRSPRSPSALERWAWSPITAFRIGLTLTYIGALYFGVSAFIAGVPAFLQAAPDGWTPPWAAVLSLSSILAAVGSAADSKPFRLMELIGSWALFICLGVYAIVLLFIAYHDGDATRAAVGAGFVALGIQPGVRMLWLMAQIGRK